MITYLKNLKFKSKIFFMIYSTVLLAVITLFVTSLYVTSLHLKKTSISTAEHTFELTKSHIEDKLDNINLWSLSMSQEPGIYDIMIEGINTNDVFDTTKKLSYISSYISSINSSDISRVHFYLDMGKPLAGINVSDISKAFETSWYKHMCEQDISVYWLAPSLTVPEDEQSVAENMLSLIRIVKNPLKNYEPMGIIMIKFKENILLDILSRQDSSNGNISYIQSADNALYTSTAPDLAENLNPDTRAFFAASSSWRQYKTNNQLYHVKSGKIHNTNLYIIHAIADNELHDILKSIFPMFSLILIIVLLISYFIANRISYSVTKRITELADNLKSVEKEHLVIADCSDSAGGDDISNIISSCNNIILRINDLSNRQFKDGQKLKEAEFRLQREQINPHFLYNTLNLIKYLSIKEKNSKIANVVTALAKFYKISLNNGSDIITIDEEIKHIEYYTEIQNMRFDNKIHLITEVPEEIRKCNTIKLILQPIIENSISHGILPKNAEEGTIKVSAYSENNDIYITVADDGIGIPPDKLSQLLSDTSSGFGLKNTHLRINLYYGEDYGIEVKSEYGKYTLVKIKISRNTNPGRFING